MRAVNPGCLRPLPPGVSRLRREKLLEMWEEGHMVVCEMWIPSGGRPIVTHPEPLSTTLITGQLLEWLH